MSAPYPHARFLAVDAEVRYWEDASVNGRNEDEDNPTIPFKEGASWKPVIDLDSGQVLNWPVGTTANTHYKVCDAGIYTLLDAQHQPIVQKEGYVPDILAPQGKGFGDYIILQIDNQGVIAGWRRDLRAFAPNTDA